jgi:hypothetical protein
MAPDDLGPPICGQVFSRQGQRWHRTESGDSTRRRAPGSSDCNIFPTLAGAGTYAIMGAQIRARKAAERAAREADRAEAHAWSIRMGATEGARQPSPTIGQCFNGALR